MDDDGLWLVSMGLMEMNVQLKMISKSLRELVKHAAAVDRAQEKEKRVKPQRVKPQRVKPQAPPNVKI